MKKENSEIKEVKNYSNEDNFEKIMSIVKGIGIFTILLMSYLLIPQLVGLFFHRVFKFGKNLSLFIGNSVYAIGLFAVYRDMFISKIKDFFRNISEYYGNSLKYWGFGLIAMFISNLILSYFVFSGNIAANEELNRSFLIGNPIIGFMSVVVFAPFVEEMIFRFGLEKMVRFGKYFPLISALVFGLPHALAGISSLPGDAIQFLYVIPYGALGYAFGYIYKKYNNIFCSMSVHMTHNLMCFLIIIFMK